MSIAATELSVLHYRSFDDRKIELDPGITVLVGRNAVGKTNLVEALQLLTAGASFRKPTASELLRENERFGRIRLTHVNLNDGTAEGIQLLDAPCFSVQYHPEASPGPTDAHYLFTAFARLMAGEPDYLSIDIAADRLAGWNFATEEN